MVELLGFGFPTPTVDMSRCGDLSTFLGLAFPHPGTTCGDLVDLLGFGLPTPVNSPADMLRCGDLVFYI